MHRILVAMMALSLTAGCGKLRGPAGAEGPQGSVGAAGKDGAPGKDGQDAAVIFVPFCPGISGAYPEYGIKTSQGLFAVYYDSNGAHMAMLTAGTYVTTDGRNCTFTVSSTGEIQ